MSVNVLCFLLLVASMNNLEWWRQQSSLDQPQNNHIYMKCNSSMPKSLVVKCKHTVAISCYRRPSCNFPTHIVIVSRKLKCRTWSYWSNCYTDIHIYLNIIYCVIALILVVVIGVKMMTAVITVLSRDWKCTGLYLIWTFIHKYFINKVISHSSFYYSFF